LATLKDNHIEGIQGVYREEFSTGFGASISGVVKNIKDK
jgi:hypothetical protein